MSRPVERLLSALERVRVTRDLSPEEIADALWLASRISGVARSSDAAPPPAPEPVPEPSEEMPPSSRPPEADVQAPPAGSPAPPKWRPRQDAARVDVPVVAERPLPARAALTSALKRSLPRVAVEDPEQIDEEATAERIACENVVEPVPLRAWRRQLDVALLVDDGVSMLPWRGLVADVERVLRQSGAFRDVRTWSFRAERETTLRPGLAPRNRAAIRAPHRAVSNPTGRRLVLVLSDCTARGWREGHFVRTLTDWARWTPVALVQALPRTMWWRTALGRAEDVRLRAGPLFTGNSGFAWSHEPPLPAMHRGSTAPVGVRFPVLALDARAMARFAHLLGGIGRESVPGVMWTSESFRSADVDESAPPHGAAERLQQFRETVSPTARQLGALLAAAAPLTLWAIRMIRQAMLPEAGVVHEAEVLMSGLLQVVRCEDDSGDAELDLAGDTEQERDDLRALLLNGVSTYDAIEVIKKMAAHDAVGGQTLRVVLGDIPGGAGTVRRSGPPLERVAAQVFLRSGGDYRRLVEPLEASAVATAPVEPRAQDEGSAPLPGPVPSAPALGDALVVVRQRDGFRLRFQRGDLVIEASWLLLEELLAAEKDLERVSEVERRGDILASLMPERIISVLNESAGGKPLTVMGSEIVAPFELLRIRHLDKNREFLGVARPVLRWIPEPALAAFSSRLTVDRIAFVRPRGEHGVPLAATEEDEVRARFPNVPFVQVTTRAELSALLREDVPGLIHFAGHASDDEGVLFADGVMSATDLQDLWGSTQKPPFFFLNAGGIWGPRMLLSLIGRGCPGGVAPSMPVTDRAAVAAARAFYDAIGAGRTVGEAVVEVRRRATSDDLGAGSAVALLSYVAFARPDAMLSFATPSSTDRSRTSASTGATPQPSSPKPSPSAAPKPNRATADKPQVRRTGSASRALQRAGREIHDKLRLRLTWPPNVPIRLGDVGRLDGGIFFKLTSLAELGVPDDLGTSVARAADIDIRSQGTNVIAFGMNQLTLPRAGSVFLNMRGSSAHSFDVALAAARLKALAEARKWEADWVLVSQVISCEELTLVIGGGADEIVMMSVSTPIKVMPQSSSTITFQAFNVTPLLRALGVSRSFFTREVRVVEK